MGCAVCINCGKCTGKIRPGLNQGVCPICGQTNPVGSKRCEKCSFEFPPPPGADMRR